MKITVKLFATFQKGRFTIEQREYSPGTAVGNIVAELQIAVESVGILLVNSRHVKLDRELVDGDVLAIFPLVGGG